MLVADAGTGSRGSTWTNAADNWLREYVGPDGKTYNLSNPSDRNYVFENFVYSGKDPEYANFIQNAAGMLSNSYRQWVTEYEARQQAASSGDWLNYQNTIANNGVDLTAEQEAYMNNMVEQQNTQAAREWEEYMRNTQYTSAGEQAEKMGLSPGVVAFGAASSNGVGAAQTMHSNAASLRQQRQMNDYNNKMGLAKSLIGMAGSMASSGIYGHAIGATRNAAAKLATATAHSGLQALQSLRPEVRNQLMKDEAWRYNNSHYEGL